jgi:N-methylhydantoinase A
LAYRISVDTGGTFTDVVLVDDAGAFHVGKALTNRERAFDSIAAGLDEIAERLGHRREALLARTSRLTYGTTRATNAIIEGTTARTAFLTTEGFPDILLLREGGKHDPFKQHPYPPPYVPRHLTWEIRERMDAEGEAFAALDEASVLAAIDGIRETRCEAVGVCLLWSTVNPSHELRVGELLEQRLPGVPFTLSHQLNPIVREYRRASSTVIDASLKPLMQAFIGRLAEDLESAGFRGSLLFATSFGGSWRPPEMLERPIYSVASGPSLAPVAARTYAADVVGAGRLDLLVCDTGGTTFDVGLVEDGAIQTTAETWLGGRWVGHITGTRAVDVTSIGAGGGSIVWRDAGGLLHVGPHSAGADPGPACYGRGGTRPTVTDAAVLLGWLDESNFLGGRLHLDAAAAGEAFGGLAEELGKSIEETAHAAMTIASENIVGAIREITIARGVDPRELLIVAGGGASGLNIVPIARELGCRRVLLPATAGALSACGGMYSDVIAEFPISQYAETRAFDRDAVNAALEEIEDRARGFLEEIGAVGVHGTELRLFVDARYRSQVWELELALPSARFHGDGDVRALEQAFHELHQRVFAVQEPGQYLECLVWKVRAVAQLDKPASHGRPAAVAAASRRDTAAAYFDGHGTVDVPRWDGAALAPGDVVVGPAIIREPTTTVVVHPGSRTTVTGEGHYLIDIQPIGEATQLAGTAEEVVL